MPSFHHQQHLRYTRPPFPPVPPHPSSPRPSSHVPARGEETSAALVSETDAFAGWMHGMSGAVMGDVRRVAVLFGGGH